MSIQISSCVPKRQPFKSEPILEHVLKGGQIKVVVSKKGQSKLARMGIFDRFCCIFSSWKRKNLTRVTEFLLANQTDAKIRAISRAFFKQKRSGRAQVVRDFERKVVATLSDPSPAVLSAASRKELDRWKRYAGERHEKIFLKYPDFTDWLEKSKLLSQIKICRDPDAIKIINNEPKVKVTLFDSGKSWDRRKTTYMGLGELQARFEFRWCKERQRLIIQEIGTGDIYTFLDNDKGLQKFDPYDLSRELIKNPIPVAILNNKELRQAQSIASKFDRDNKPNKNPFVLQIVSSYINGKKWNFLKLLHLVKHSYLRLIAAQDNPELGLVKGGVYELGFGTIGKEGALFSVKRGGFFVLDPWEYMPCKERVVTYIPVTQKEVHKILDFTKRYHESQKVGFHLREQNCTVFVRQIVSYAGIRQKGEDIAPTQMHVTEAVQEIAPDIIQPKVKSLALIVKGDKKAIDSLPEPINDKMNLVLAKIIRLCFKVFKLIALILAVLSSSVLGGFSRSKGELMTKDQEEHTLKATLWKAKSWTSLEEYIFNFPSILQKWQRAQNIDGTNEGPTIIYENPQHLTILPKPAPHKSTGTAIFG